ncbi:MAG: biopolymer transporter ExbD [Nitrospinota bacterium]|nr:MAG: biopolymer transporter ExbD [Nitrospinota bacterium]
MIEFTRRKRVENTLNIAPLIDIVFLLLIFFLLTSTFMHTGIELTLPEAQTAEVQDVEEHVISLTGEGELYLDLEPVSWEDLPERLQQSLANSPEKVVVINADRGVPLGFFVRAMDISRQAGALEVTISTRPPGDDTR